MKNIYTQKLHSLTRKKVSLWCAIIFAVLIFMLIVNENTGRIFVDIINLFSGTAEKDILFIPLGLLIVCESFDDRNTYIIRFRNRLTWFKNEFVFITVILFFYSIIYIIDVSAAGFIIALISKKVIQINFHSFLLLLLIFMRRFIYLMMSMCIMLLLYLILKKNIYVTGFFVFISLEIFQMVENIYSITKYIRPILDTSASLLQNAFNSLPEIIITISITILIFFKSHQVKP